MTSFGRPGSVGGAGTVVRSMTDDMIAVTVERCHVLGPLASEDLARLNALRPHLARAALMASRLKLQRAQSAVDILSALRLPAAAVGPSGRLIVTNPEFDALMPDIVADVAGRLTFTATTATKTIRELLADDGAKLPRGLSFPLRLAAPRGFAIVHVLPLVRDGRDIFASATRLVLLTGTGFGPGGDSGVLEGLFDLTPAEARVARALLAGGSVSEIARGAKLSPDTVRGQLKSVFRKTGTRGQVELVRLLGGIGR